MYADSVPILPLLLLAGTVVALFLLYRAARRATTIAELAIEDGAVRVAYGGVAPGILRDLGDVARRPKIGGARIVITRANGRAAVTVHGAVTADQVQRFRNVVGSVPLAKLVNARRRA